jgi:hypothetical protein
LAGEKSARQGEQSHFLLCQIGGDVAVTTDEYLNLRLPLLDHHLLLVFQTANKNKKDASAKVLCASLASLDDG